MFSLPANWWMQPVKYNTVFLINEFVYVCILSVYILCVVCGWHLLHAPCRLCDRTGHWKSSLCATMILEWKGWSLSEMRSVRMTLYSFCRCGEIISRRDHVSCFMTCTQRDFPIWTSSWTLRHMKLTGCIMWPRGHCR